MRKRIFKHLFFIALLTFLASPLYAQTKWKTSKYIEMAREALALGEMGKWAKALKLADKAFEREKSKMDFTERNNHKLWITLFWSKYHQYKGILPPIKGANEFESKKDLEAQIAKVKKSIEHLKKGLAFLRTYNLMYMQVAQRSNLQNQIYLQASLSLERDLGGTIRQGQIYKAFLNYVKQNWNDKKKLSKKLKHQAELIEKIKKKQSSEFQQVIRLKKEQQKLAYVVAKAQRDYERVKKNLNAQETRANIMIWAGLAGVIIGGAGFAGATYYWWDAKNNGIGKDITKRNIAVMVGMALMEVSAAIFILGGSSLILGIVLKPSEVAKNKAILKSQNEYLDVERNRLKLDKTSWLHPKKYRPSKILSLGVAKTVVLGRW